MSRTKGQIMKLDDKSLNLPLRPSSIPATTAKIQADMPSVHETRGNGAAIDMHSVEFNSVDELNDLSGNYRFFETLDGVRTAHEQHHREHTHHTDAAHLPVDEMTPVITPGMIDDEAEVEERAASLTVVSQGRTLIIGTDAERAESCGRILSEKRLVCTLLVTKPGAKGLSPPKPYRPACLETNGVSITGAFGSFSAMVDIESGRKSLAECFGDEAATFDLVLDLQPIPSYAGDCLPIGYYAPGSNPVALNEALQELPEMRGRFEKPQFISFLKTRCFHGRSRAHDCHECIDICPFGAIQSVGRKISINHYPCQGCGGCVLACPVDAVCINQPSQGAILNSLWSSVENLPSDQRSSSSLVISDLEPAVGNEPPTTGQPGDHRRVHCRVGQIGHVGLEVLLVALSHGVGAILVVCGSKNPPKIRNAVERQVKMAQAILRGLELSEDACRFAVIPPEGMEAEIINFKPGELSHGPVNKSDMRPVIVPAGHDKRTLVRLIIQRLHDQSGVSRPVIPLPVGSPFGAVAVETAACTLCMACSAVCPSGALSACSDATGLLFRESQCHQCGLCKAVCPEGAVRLVPRLLCDPKAVEAQVVLHEACPFRCIVCDTPFASQAMVERIKQKLTGHWMYASERQLKRLQMCATCRTRDVLTSGEIG
jgi:ferredoxin